jgi:transcriptional regulator of heat shock response
MDAQSLLASVSQTPVNELENFVRELNALIIRKKTDDTEHRDRALLSKINKAVLAKNKAERYVMLHLKLEAETITDLEYQEFMDLVAQDENLRNERVKYLIELAQLRAVTLPQLMNSLGLNISSND